MRSIRSSLCARGVPLFALAWGVLAASACAVESSRETEPPSPLEPVGAASQAIEPTPAWTETGGMSVARRGPTATLLEDGRVLITGGQRAGAIDTGDVFFETAEIWVPLPGKFNLVPAKMAFKREYHAAVRLPDGKVLVAGGLAGGQGTAEIFDPKTGTWTLTALHHPHPQGATAVLLNDDRVLLVGGDDGGGAVEIFDPATLTWTDAAPLLVPRRFHAATLLKDGRVLVTGGSDFAQAPKATRKVEVYDPKTNTWKLRGPMAIARSGHGAARLENGPILVIGGASETLPATETVEVYDIGTNDWTAGPPLTTARVLHATTVLDNGAVLVTGGVDTTGSVLRSTELYDLDAQRWVSAGQLHHGRLAHAVVALEGGGALAAGGEDQSTAEVYSSAENGQPCEVGRQCASGFCVDGVCCNTACDGQCVTCGLAGFEGDCSIAPAGTDPHNDCGGGGLCDDVCAANGTCTDRVGEVCIPSSCLEDGIHAILQATCKAPGGSCDTASVDCTPYRCGLSSEGALPGCLVTCRSIDDCAEGYACDPAGHCELRPDVAATDSEACSAGPNSASSSTRFAWLAAILVALVGLRRARRRSADGASRSATSLDPRSDR